MAPATGSVCDPFGRRCGADIGRVVASILGALGSAVLVGLDRLTVCRCDASAPRDLTGSPPWSYGDLEDVEIGRYGSLPVIQLRLSDRADLLPILLLGPGQVGPALDGLVILRRLIADAHRPGKVKKKSASIFRDAVTTGTAR
jgi:hypothetical protein